jgi:hypothetical protein
MTNYHVKYGSYRTNKIIGVKRKELVINTSRSFPHSCLIAGFVTILTRRVSLVEQELLTLPEHLSLSPVFSGVRVTRSLVLRVCFVDRCLSFCTFSFDHCVVFSSLIYGFCWPLWYLQTLPIEFHHQPSTTYDDSLHVTRVSRYSHLPNWRSFRY